MEEKGGVGEKGRKTGKRGKGEDGERVTERTRGAGDTFHDYSNQAFRKTN